MRSAGPISSQQLQDRRNGIKTTFFASCNFFSPYRHLPIACRLSALGVHRESELKRTALFVSLFASSPRPVRELLGAGMLMVR
jgi:hypothetical protein